MTIRNDNKKILKVMSLFRRFQPILLCLIILREKTWLRLFKKEERTQKFWKKIFEKINLIICLNCRLCFLFRDFTLSFVENTDILLIIVPYFRTELYLRQIVFMCRMLASKRNKQNEISNVESTIYIRMQSIVGQRNFQETIW